MSSLMWVALAGALLLLPPAAQSAPRAQALVARGRLAVARPALAPRHRTRRRGPPVPSRSLAAVGCAGLALAIGWLTGVALGIACGAASLAITWLARSGHQRRQRQRRHVELLAGLRVLVAELEAGSRPADALRAAAASAPRYGAVLDRAAREASTSGQIAPTLRASAPAELHPLAHGWAMAERCGVPLAAIVSRVVDDLADRVAQQRAVAVALAGPRSSALLLALLPLLGIGLGTAMGARPLPFLLATPTGHGVCAGGVLLETAGLVWTARLLARAERS